MDRFELCWILIGSHEKRLNFYWFTQIAKIRLVYERCQNNTSASYLVVNTKLQCDVVFFSFAYTTSPAAVMKLVVFFRSSKPPYNFWWSGVAEGHCAIRSGWCLLHIWRTGSVVWSSSPPGHVGEGTIFSFLCMCALM